MTAKLPKIPKLLTASISLLAASLGLLLCARHLPFFADWYTDSVYRVLVGTLGRFFGLFPFSFVELALYGAILFWLGYLVWTARFSRCAEGWKCFLCRLLLFASALFFSYTVCCGINYHHASFSETTKLKVSAYSSQDLAQLCRYLTEETNRLAPEMARAADGTALMTPPAEERAKPGSTGRHGDTSLPSRARETMRNLGALYPEMDGYYPRPKPLLFSYILSVQNLTGIYSPFTVEANYNRDMTGYNQPFTACHELSHLRGFMQEEEANYLAFLACIHSDYPEFRYSGYLTGWVYAMNQLYRADYTAYQELLPQLSRQARADVAANHAFWSKYDGRVAEVANQINDNYLKANGQGDGVQSYDKMVNLMIAYYQENYEK